MKPMDAVLVRNKSWYATRESEKIILALSDLISLLAAFFLARFLVNAFSAAPAIYTTAEWVEHQGYIRFLTYFVLICFTIPTLWVKGHYSKRRPYSNEVKEVLRIVAALTLVDAALVFFGRWDFSRSALLLNWVMVPFVLLGFRALLKVAMLRSGAWIRPMVIVGYGENAIETARAFEAEMLMGYQLSAFLIPVGKTKMDTPFRDKQGRAIPCISLGNQPEQTLTHLGMPHVVLALEHGGIDAFQSLIQQLGRHSGNMQIVPSLRGLPLHGMEVNHFFAHEVLLLTLRNNLARRGPQMIKRGFDLCASVILMVVCAPLLLWIVLRIRKEGPGPLFFGHMRIGQNGAEFPCYKFRTMATNADILLKELLANDPQARAEWEQDFKLKNDPRITSIGRFLRKTSLDELPQLWNVFLGDMSLVGPRPVVYAELERYGSQVDYYLEARPGITGLWQTSGRNDVSYDTRVYLDAWYVKNWSLFTDIVILFRTIKVLMKTDGAY